MLKKLLFITICLLLFGSSFGQGYKIEGKITGLKDSTCYLTYYYDNQNFVQDSAQIGVGGTLVFSGKTPLKEGMYNVMIGHWQSFDLLIGEQKFSFEANVDDLFGTLKFKGSRENDLFYSYQQKTFKDSKRLKELSIKEDSVSLNAMYALQFESEQYKKKFVKAFEGTFASKIIKSTMQADVPETPKLADGTPDPQWINKYFVAHYFDNLDLKDNRFVRTPFLDFPVKNYFAELETLPNDSLIIIVDQFLGKTQKTSELRKFLVTKLTNHFETSKIMGKDAIFVHLMEKYYINEPLMWDSTTVKLVKQRVKYLKPLLLGSKIPNLKATDTNGKIRELYETKTAFTILYIYAADCAHCELFTPQLVKFMEINKDKNIGVFAPIFGNNQETWKEFIQKNGSSMFTNVIDLEGKVNLYQEFDAQFTPTIYLLDKDKKIIGKGNMPIQMINEIIEEHQTPIASGRKF